MQRKKKKEQTIYDEKDTYKTRKKKDLKFY